MPVQILATKYLSENENLWLSSLTDKLSETQFEKVVQESLKLSTKINALLYALVIANPHVLEEVYKKMETTLGDVMKRIGYVDKNVYEAKMKEAQDKIAKLAVKAEEEKAEKVQLAKTAEEEKARLAKSAEEEKARLAKLAEEEKVKNLELQKRLDENEIKQIENAVDMLRTGTPVDLIAKWTLLPENRIQHLKSDIDLSIN